MSTTSTTLLDIADGLQILSGLLTARLDLGATEITMTPAQAEAFAADLAQYALTLRRVAEESR